MAVVLRSCNHFSRILSLFPVRICPCQPLIPKCGYTRGRGRGRQGKGQEMLPKNFKLSEIPDESQLGGESSFIDPDEGEKAQSFDDFYNRFGDQGPSASQLQQFAKNEREKLKLKILKRKYFKDPQESNFLTWETKEQIRFLHREFPEDWTIEKLSESFPVGKDSIIKLLKSSYVIKTAEKMLAHDLKVKEKWKELESELSREGGPINPQYMMLIESGKLDLMKNAATLKGAPKRVLRLRDGTKTGGDKVGVFSSIVKDYAPNKTPKKERTEDEKLSSPSYESELNTLLEAINVQQKNSNPVPGNPSDRTSSSSSEEEIERSGGTHENPSTEPHKIPRSMRRRLKGEDVSIENLSYLEAYQTMGTGKVGRDESVDTKMKKKVSENVVFREREPKKHFEYPVQQYRSPAPNMHQNMQNDTRQQSWDPSFRTQIKIPKHLEHKKGVLYRKKDTYYDETGEILYRVPVKE